MFDTHSRYCLRWCWMLGTRGSGGKSEWREECNSRIVNGLLVTWASSSTEMVSAQRGIWSNHPTSQVCVLTLRRSASCSQGLGPLMATGHDLMGREGCRKASACRFYLPGEPKHQGTSHQSDASMHVGGHRAHPTTSQALCVEPNLCQVDSPIQDQSQWLEEMRGVVLLISLFLQRASILPSLSLFSLAVAIKNWAIPGPFPKMATIDEEMNIGAAEPTNNDQGAPAPNVTGDGAVNTFPLPGHPAGGDAGITDPALPLNTPTRARGEFRRGPGLNNREALGWFKPNTWKQGIEPKSFGGAARPKRAQPWLSSVLSALSSKLGWVALRYPKAPHDPKDANVGEEVLKIEFLHRYAVLWARSKLLQHSQGIANADIVDDRVGGQVSDDLRRYCKSVSGSYVTNPHLDEAASTR